MLIFTFVSIRLLTKKSYVSAKIEAIKHLHAVSLLTGNSVDVQTGDCSDPWFILMSSTSRGSMFRNEFHFSGVYRCVNFASDPM